MLGLGKPKPVAEHEADPVIERIYYEIKQCLRVTGVNLNFRTWAGYRKFFTALWDEMRPNVETRYFEDASDRIRAESVATAREFGPLNARARVRLGESQAWQIQAALMLYHYINPKLLLLTSAVRLALDGGAIGGVLGSRSATQLIERGAPTRMYPMEMVSEEPDNPEIRELFEDIKRTLALESVNSDYRTLALWPDYLAPAWQALKPLVTRQEYMASSAKLAELARSLARTLPYSVALPRERFQEAGEDANEIVKTTIRFERLLPSLILNVSLFALDWKGAGELAHSPFPAAPRPEAGRTLGGVA